MDDLSKLENIVIIAGGYALELSAFNYVDGLIDITSFGASQEADDDLYAWGMRYFYPGKSLPEKMKPIIDKEGTEIASRIKKECRKEVRVFYWPIGAKNMMEL